MLLNILKIIIAFGLAGFVSATFYAIVFVKPEDYETVLLVISPVFVIAGIFLGITYICFFSKYIKINIIWIIFLGYLFGFLIVIVTWFISDPTFSSYSIGVFSDVLIWGFVIGSLGTFGGVVVYFLGFLRLN